MNEEALKRPAREANPKPGRVLVVEDESDIRDLIVMHIAREGHTVESCANGNEAAQLLEQRDFDLLIVDWMLPDKSGLELTREVRRKYGYDSLGVLMVTAKATNEDLIRGLESGADDYLTKPFELSVLIARARALLRRTERKDATLALGPLVIDEAAHEARLRDTVISLTPYEFKLLTTLVQNKGRVLTRDRLIAEVQGSGVAVVERAIDTHVFGLRKKLGESGDMIETVRGVGYRINSKN
jgi:two-component system phosphate regulon response regulator PhoB